MKRSPIISSGVDDWDFFTDRGSTSSSRLPEGISKNYFERARDSLLVQNDFREVASLIPLIKTHAEPRLIVGVIYAAIRAGISSDRVQALYTHSIYYPCDICHKVFSMLAKILRLNIYCTYSYPDLKAETANVLYKNNIQGDKPFRNILILFVEKLRAQNINIEAKLKIFSRT